MRACSRIGLIAAIVTCFATARTDAAVPPLLAWQGVALDSLDQPLPDGSYTFGFTIYNAAAGGDSLWGETQIVSVQDGVLSVLLGSVTPVPDTVFRTTNAYLQVRFESEAPYVPRTRIASVGYAFRVGTLDGASGGQVSSNIDLRSNFTVPRLRLFREGGATVIGELATAGSGGRLTLYDNSGAKILEMKPDPADGGQLALYTHKLLGTGVAMYNTGNDNPLLVMQGTSAAALFNMDSAGNSSVQLPLRAISAPEILDEPGLASSAMTSASTAIGTAYTVLESVTATFPAAGYAMVFGEASIRAETANTWLDCRILEDGSERAFCWWDPGDVDGWFDERNSIIATMPVTVGTHTYTMEVKQFTGTAVAAYSKLTVLFVPTSYGVVSSPAPPGGQGDGIRAASAQPVGPAKVVDVAGERALAVAANDARILAEMEEMRARIAKLEQLLKARAAEPADEEPR